MALICEGRSTFSMERVDMLSANGLCKVEGSFHENLAVVGLGAVGEGFLKTKHHRVRMGKCTRATRKM